MISFLFCQLLEVIYFVECSLRSWMLPGLGLSNRETQEGPSVPG